MQKVSDAPDDFKLSKEDRLAAIAVAFFSFVILLIVVVVRIPRSDLGEWVKVLGSVGQLVFSLVGLIAAGWWWLHRGSVYPRLKITQSIDLLPATGNEISLYVMAHLENVGEVPVVLTKWCLWATDMLPLPSAIDELLNTKPDRACRDYRLPWVAAAGSEFEMLMPHSPRVFPGESQDIGALLRVPVEVQWLRVYSYLPREGPSSEGGTRGWTTITLVNLAKEIQMEKERGADRGTEVYEPPGGHGRPPGSDLPYDPPSRDRDFERRDLPYDPPQRPDPNPPSRK